MGDDDDENEFLQRLPRWIFTGASALIFITIVLNEHRSFLLFLWVFSTGVGFAYTLLMRTTLVPSMLLWSRRDKLAKAVGLPGAATSVVGCPVCGDDKCARHRGEVSRLEFEPWESVKVRKEIDKGLSRFMELLMKNYVAFWYKEVSEDLHAEHLLRMGLRHVTAIFVQRLSKIDIAKLISGKFIQAAMYHMNMYVAAKRKVGPGASQEELVEAVCREYGPRLHRALRGGAYAERQYLCRITDAITPFTLPMDVQQCRGLKLLLREIVGPGLLQLTVDTIVDPDFLNKMLIILVEPAVPVEELTAPEQLVPLLDTFSRPLRLPSLMVPSLNEIKLNTKLLLPFMNFLKARGLIGLLQFCLETGEFQDELDRVSKDRINAGRLLRKVQQIYSSYFATQSADYLYGVDDDTVMDLKTVCDYTSSGQVDKAVSVLMETMPIARAYSKIYGTLERDYVPLFLASNQHLRLICGDKFPKQLRSRSFGTASRLEPLKNLAKLGRRLKKHLRTSRTDIDIQVTASSDTAIAGASGSAVLGLDAEEGDDVAHGHADNDSIAEGETLDVEGVDPEGSGDEGVMVDKSDSELNPAFVDDFTSWKISIAGVESRYAGKRSFFVYRILSDDGVDSPGMKREPIGRRFSEFFILHRRLTQFHGDIGIHTSYQETAQPQQDYTQADPGEEPAIPREILTATYPASISEEKPGPVQFPDQPWCSV
ncbi:sorting nexin-14-like [Sycon ciliatum]|uniref:sorting nexin-14-like n=1 Tax=Sycon ciliatum TaxID=27933 RepID=UPI0031F6C7F4